MELSDSLWGSSVKLGTIQIILALPLRKDDTHKPRSVNGQVKTTTFGKTPKETKANHKHCLFSYRKHKFTTRGLTVMFLTVIAFYSACLVWHPHPKGLIGGVQLSIMILSIKNIPTSFFWNAIIWLEHSVFKCNEFLLILFRIPEILGRAKR